MTVSTVANAFHEQVRAESSRWIWLGVAFLAVGVASLAFPMVSTLAATIFVGWLLVISGLLTVFSAFSVRGAGPFFGALLFGLLSIAGGVFMLARPLSGELAITLTLGVLFMIQGAFEVFLAFELRPARAWTWMLISALASILLSVIIVSGFPGTSLVTLGVIIGVNFISSGLGYIMLGNTAKKELGS
jgi:uncharacterized membrane protein HdeD (DUF308 family)